MDYHIIANSYNELHGKEQLNKVKIILKLLKIKKEKVLDVGCGTAFYSNLFENYEGIDSNKKMLKQSNANVNYGNGENMQFKDNSFDTIISVSSIHNFNNPLKGIEEIKRVAKNKIAISVFKRSKNFKIIEKELHDFKKFKEDKDIIFYKII